MAETMLVDGSCEPSEMYCIEIIGYIASWINLLFLPVNVLSP